MRHLHFYLFGFAALVAACQPVTPTTVNSKAAPTITVAPEGQTDIDLVVSTVTKTADGAAGAVNNAGSGTDEQTPKTRKSPPFRQRRPFSQRPFSRESSAAISSQSDDRISINHFGSRSWHCEYDPAGRPD